MSCPGGGWPWIFGLAEIPWFPTFSLSLPERSGYFSLCGKHVWSFENVLCLTPCKMKPLWWYGNKSLIPGSSFFQDDLHGVSCELLHQNAPGKKQPRERVRFSLKPSNWVLLVHTSWETAIQIHWWFFNTVQKKIFFIPAHVSERLIWN